MQQRLEAMSNLEVPHFHAGMISLARYAQYLFILQYNTARTGMQQRTRLTTYKKSATATTLKIERLRHENAILRSGARPPSEQDCELQGVYCHLSDTEHGWNYTCMLLNITHEEVEAQDAKLEERTEMIADLEQQLLELQV
jgi:predicted RNase H-like nuclease (RuvC/YqgF family)